MRRFYLLILFCSTISGLSAQVNTNAPWVWMGGEKHIPLRPIYGTKNIAAPENNPGGRKEAVSWKDRDGNFWLFGGFGCGGNFYGYLNDLWKYDPLNSMWTWINGDNELNLYGIYGTKDIPSSNNKPGSRRGSVGWVDEEGNLCLFGGDGYSATAAGRLNDIWKYNIQTNQWTWIAGPDTTNSKGVYGSQGISSSSNFPGARNGATLLRHNNTIWLFGGDGFATNPTGGRLNDLWKYNTISREWVWISGANTINAATVVNTMPGGRGYSTGWKDNSGNLYFFGGLSGVQLIGPDNYGHSFTVNNELWKYTSSTNSWSRVGTGMFAGDRPTARGNSLGWTDSQGNFWLYGGNNTVIDYFSDLYRYNPSTNYWTQVKKDSSYVNFAGIHGTQNVPDIKNRQGDRSGAVGWIDASDRLWTFGGVIYTDAYAFCHNDLWQYDPATNLTTWLKGDSAETAKPFYVSQGVANVINTPGERRTSASWTDNNGDLWLFGGNIQQIFYGPVGKFKNDLWKYSVASGQWTWMRGTGNPVSYGTMGVPGPTNNPSDRETTTTWTDAANNLWLFGGRTSSNYMNDLWKYNPATNEWTWMNGRSFSSFFTFNQYASYGIQGVPNANNTPGARPAACNWKDNDGNFWLFGGLQINDLWKYNVATNQWTWMKGDTVSNKPGIYGIQGVASVNNKPGARGNSVSWKDNAGNLWLFGGDLYFSSISGYKYVNDLWKYDIATNDWTWISGDSSYNSSGIYGTKGIAAGGNKPGARNRAISWTDNNGNFWLMGGWGLDANGSYGCLNDLWMYSPNTNQWMWVNGSNTINVAGTYGIKSVGNSSTNPGGRYSAASWKDSSGNLWLYGGYGFGEMGQDRLSDLWKLSIAPPSSLATILELTGKLVNLDGVLNWKAQNNGSSATFIIERSTDRMHFIGIGATTSNNTSGLQQFDFTDPVITLLGAPVIYYRIKQTDINGNTSYSNIVALTIDGSALVIFYPNPVLHNANMTITINYPEVINARIFNSAGALMKRFQWNLPGGSTILSMDLTKLAAGIYFLDLSGKTISKHIKFMKQ